MKDIFICIIFLFTFSYSENFEYFESNKLAIANGTKFKIEGDKTATIIGGFDSCEDKSNIFFTYLNQKDCTIFENKDKFQFFVVLFSHFEKNTIVEPWTVIKNGDNLALERPNGYKVKPIK